MRLPLIIGHVGFCNSRRLHWRRSLATMRRPRGSADHGAATRPVRRAPRRRPDRSRRRRWHARRRRPYRRGTGPADARARRHRGRSVTGSTTAPGVGSRPDSDRTRPRRSSPLTSPGRRRGGPMRPLCLLPPLRSLWRHRRSPRSRIATRPRSGPRPRPATVPECPALPRRRARSPPPAPGRLPRRIPCRRSAPVRPAWCRRPITRPPTVR